MDLATQLRRDEGERLKPYKDSRGFLTIGYGRNLDARGISQQEAEFLLANDIAVHKEALLEALPWVAELDEVRQAVFLNMCFNLGIAGLLQFKKSLALAKAGLYSEAAANLRLSLWRKQVGARADRLAKQLETGEWQ